MKALFFMMIIALAIWADIASGHPIFYDFITRPLTEATIGHVLIPITFMFLYHWAVQ